MATGTAFDGLVNIDGELVDYCESCGSHSTELQVGDGEIDELGWVTCGDCHDRNRKNHDDADREARHYDGEYEG